MADFTSVASSAAAIFAQPTAAIKQAANATTTSFAATLSKVQGAVGLRPKTGFTSGPTYEAGTITGQTKGPSTTPSTLRNPRSTSSPDRSRPGCAGLALSIFEIGCRHDLDVNHPRSRQLPNYPLVGADRAKIEFAIGCE